MGMDFSALLQYDGPTENAISAISQLEANPHHPATDAVVELGRKEDFAFADELLTQADWRTYSDGETPLSSRPNLPNLEVFLHLPSDFNLTFGRDTIWIYHSLRWLSFTTEHQWQTVMLKGLCYFYDLFCARDCIVTSDFNPAILEFQNGASFSTAISTAESKGEGCVDTLDDLYLDKGFADDLAFVDADGRESAIPIWDSHGFWRLKCNSEFR